MLGRPDDVAEPCDARPGRPRRDGHAVHRVHAEQPSRSGAPSGLGDPPATDIGFAIGALAVLAIPAENASSRHRSPLKTTEHALDRWSSFGNLLLFGFANAGIAFNDIARDDPVGTLPIEITLKLLIGKPIGVFGITWLPVPSGLAPMPEGVTWRRLGAMAMLCGIGFTISLFIGGLAFGENAQHLNAVRIGAICGPITAAILGLVKMRVAPGDRAPRIEDRLHAVADQGASR